MKTTRHLLLLTAALASTFAFAQDAAPAAVPAAAAAPASPPPPADEIKRVLDFQENGKDRGPALLDLIACTKVDTTKGSPTQFTCVEPVTSPVKKGTSVLSWTQWFCPKGGKYEDITIKYVLESDVRTTIDITIEGLARTRTWRGYTVTKAGKWAIKVFRGTQELGSTSFTVEN